MNDANESNESGDIAGQRSLAGLLLKSPSFFLATGAGVGLSPVAPGTIGTLWGLPLAWVIAQVPGWPIQLAIIVALNLVGVPICTAAARMIGRKDPGAVVWDEIATLPITFLFIPAAEMNSVLMLAAGFGLHRLFDITKVPPAKQLESLPDGLGIMADDWSAGVYSCLSLHALRATGILG